MTMSSNDLPKVIPQCDQPESLKGHCRGCENSLDPRLYDGGCRLLGGEQEREK